MSDQVGARALILPLFRPFPRCRLPLFLNEPSCETIQYENVFLYSHVHFMQIKLIFIYKWFRTKTRFEREANDNAKMAKRFHRTRVDASAESFVQLSSGSQEKFEQVKIRRERTRV